MFITRQPIFNQHSEAVCYELQFRDDAGAYLSLLVGQGDGQQVTVGFDKLIGGKRAVVPYCQQLLDFSVAQQLPRNLITVDLSQAKRPTEEIADICVKLKEQGYLIGVTDGMIQSQHQEILEYVDIVKVDFSQVLGSRRQECIAQVKSLRVNFWAINVETAADFARAAQMGYSFMSGQFYLQPVIATGRQLNVRRGQYLKILSELARPDLDFAQLETVIQHDVAFSYKLLTFINSVAFGFKSTIRSIKQALVLLGKKEVLQWVASLTLREAAEKKSQEVVARSVYRAKFGELLAEKLGFKDRAGDMFLLGIFSLIDVLLDRPLADIIAEIPIDQNIKDALLGKSNQLADIFHLILACEQGKWTELSACAAHLKISAELAADLHITALLWSDELTALC